MVGPGTNPVVGAICGGGAVFAPHTEQNCASFESDAPQFEQNIFYHFLIFDIKISERTERKHFSVCDFFLKKKTSVSVV